MHARRGLRVDETPQIQERTDRDSRNPFISSARTTNRIEHPGRNRYLQTVFKSNDDALLLLYANRSNDFDRLIVERVVAVMDVRRLRLMSSVLRPYATASRPISSNRAMTFERCRNFWGITMSGQLKSTRMF